LIAGPQKSAGVGFFWRIEARLRTGQTLRFFPVAVPSGAPKGGFSLTSGPARGQRFTLRIALPPGLRLLEANAAAAFHCAFGRVATQHCRVREDAVVLEVGPEALAHLLKPVSRASFKFVNGACLASMRGLQKANRDLARSTKSHLLHQRPHPEAP
jgi:hypothetical protein